MAEDPRLLRIVELLLSLTEAQRIEWQAVGTLNNPRYATSFADSSFVVYSKDADGMLPFVVELRNDRGEVLESIRSKSMRPRLRRQFTESEEAEREEIREYNKKFQDLYNRARRNAMNVDHFLDGVLAELEEQGRQAKGE
ncbi:hypothetical protein ACFCZ5_04140 [Streptomyces microflavus]|uniref:hypothetical protein n=1 Tax=Streptomyces microflavus TaxID=1919 RepID=UPI0035DABA2A